VNRAQLTEADWQVAGSYFEACNCEAICPCRSIGGRPGGTTRANYAGAVEVVHAIRPARIELEHEPRRWSIGVEGYVRVTAHDLVPCDETVACGIPGLDRPGQELRADLLQVDDAPLAWEVRGRCAFATDFEYHSLEP
jgi:hypothetical protein